VRKKNNKKGPILFEDFKDFIRLCNHYELRYLVIGGFAVSIHGYPRGTKDLDICIEASEGNADKIAKVIADFGMASLGLTPEDFLKKGMFTQLGREPVRIDIMVEMDGVPFDSAWQNKRTVNYEDEILVHFIGYHELLQLKQLASRPQDIADIAQLKARHKDQ
jgi:hypothetical protein